VTAVPGAVAIIIALLVFPVVAIMGSVTIAVLLGWALDRDAAERHEGSELIDVNY
jgi:hypothetical protein